MDFWLDTCGRRRCLLVLQLLVLKAAADCPKPQDGVNIVLTNGALLLNAFPEGLGITVECAHGYVKESGSGVISCTGGKWTEPELRCKKKDCGPPPPKPHMTFSITGGTLFGAEVKVSCEKGFQISGSSWKTCYAYGWSGRADCEYETCEYPAAVANGTSLWNSEEEPKYGEIVEFACNEGFTLVGSKSIVCSDGGEYDADHPECKALFSFSGATTGDEITPSPAPSAQGEIEFTEQTFPTSVSTSTESSTSSTAHRDKTITTSAAATDSPATQGGRGTLTDEEEASTTRASTSSFRGKQDWGVNTYTAPGKLLSSGLTEMWIIIIVLAVVCGLIVGAIWLTIYCLSRKKGSFNGTVPIY